MRDTEGGLDSFNCSELIGFLRNSSHPGTKSPYLKRIDLYLSIQFSPLERYSVASWKHCKNRDCSSAERKSLGCQLQPPASIQPVHHGSWSPLDSGRSRRTRTATRRGPTIAAWNATALAAHLARTNGLQVAGMDGAEAMTGVEFSDRSVVSSFFSSKLVLIF